EEVKSISQGDDGPAVDAQAEGADRLGHLPTARLPGRRVQPVQHRTYYICPVERLLFGGPYRAFAQYRLGIEDTAHFHQFCPPLVPLAAPVCHPTPTRVCTPRRVPGQADLGRRTKLTAH